MQQMGRWMGEGWARTTRQQMHEKRRSMAPSWNRLNDSIDSRRVKVRSFEVVRRAQDIRQDSSLGMHPRVGRPILDEAMKQKQDNVFLTLGSEAPSISQVSGSHLRVAPPKASGTFLTQHRFGGRSTVVQNSCEGDKFPSCATKVSKNSFHGNLLIALSYRSRKLRTWACVCECVRPISQVTSVSVVSSPCVSDSVLDLVRKRAAKNTDPTDLPPCHVVASCEKVQPFAAHRHPCQL
jgi:hypothetical protein